MTLDTGAVEAAGSGPIGVAVSGGGDSVALLLALTDRYGPGRLRAATVDHGLRPEAATEAAWVAELSAGLGIPYTTLTWRGWDGRGNLQAAARAARYHLLAEWGRQTGLSCVCLGHTSDDVAETLLMELGRGAGLDGLSAMDAAADKDGQRFVRPLLGTSREALRASLTDRGQGWIDDPGNEDDRFLRVRARRVLSVDGIDPGGLSAAAANLAGARRALDYFVGLWLADHVAIGAGDLLIDRPAFEALPTDAARRVMAEALAWAGGDTQAPRGAEILRLVATGGGTLGGAVVRAHGGTLRIGREPVRALSAAPASVGATWDGRWIVEGPPGVVSALGEPGLAHRPGWRAAGLPRETLIAGPAVWAGDDLLGVPMLDPGPWRLIPANGRDRFPPGRLTD